MNEYEVKRTGGLSSTNFLKVDTDTYYIRYLNMFDALLLLRSFELGISEARLSWWNVSIVLLKS